MERRQADLVQRRDLIEWTDPWMDSATHAQVLILFALDCAIETTRPMSWQGSTVAA
jgi:hypothetical protein